jgi:hypothetical protein
MKSDVAMKGRSMSARIAWWSIAKWNIAKWVGSLGWVLRFLPCLAAAFELGIEIHSYHYADHIIQERKVHEMKYRRMNFSPIEMSWVSRLGYLRFFRCLAAAFELDIQIHGYSWNGKESAVEHIISRNYYAHHYIQQRKVHHNPAKVGTHSQRLTQPRRAKTL